MRRTRTESEAAGAGEAPVRQRLDVWVWHARCVSTRSLAAALVKAGRVRVNGARTTSPAQAVRIGDVLTIALNAGVRLWRVSGFTERRGDARMASTTYVELQDGDWPDSHAS